MSKMKIRFRSIPDKQNTPATLRSDNPVHGDRCRVFHHLGVFHFPNEERDKRKIYAFKNLCYSPGKIMFYQLHCQSSNFEPKHLHLKKQVLQNRFKTSEEIPK